jgi:hypothetical protein
MEVLKIKQMCGSSEDPNCLIPFGSGNSGWSFAYTYILGVSRSIPSSIST